MKKKILLTGATGFIGLNFLDIINSGIYQDKYEFVLLDKFVDSYYLNFIDKTKSLKFYLGDFTDAHFVDRLFEVEKFDKILHLGAESFVDKSTEYPAKFTHTNVFGTQILLEASVKYGVERFHYCSTDEIYGSLKSIDPPWTEDFPPKPGNNYSASKYGGELQVHSTYRTHGLKYTVGRCANNIGIYQPYRNLFPKIVLGLIYDHEIPIHGKEGAEAIREWISPIDHCLAMIHILECGKDNEVYNIGSGAEMTNIELVHKVASHLNKEPKIKYIENRKAQDHRYSVDCSKIHAIGWKPTISFEDNLTSSIKWYQDNKDLFSQHFKGTK